MSKFIARYSLLFIGIFIDIILSSIVGLNYGYQSFIITPYAGVIGLLLVTRKLDMDKKLLVAFLYALLVEMSSINSNLIHLITIMTLVFVSEFIWTILGNSFVEKAVSLFFLVSLNIFIRFGLGKLLDMTSASFITFVTYEYVLTMFYNLVIILVMLVIELTITDRLTQKERIKKRHEHITMWD